MKDKTYRLTHVVRRILLYAVLIVVVVVVVAPVAWLLTSSLKKAEHLYAYPIVFFSDELQWDNYVKVFTLTPFLKVALRTAALALTSGAISVFTSAMVGYGFARFRVPGSRFLFWFVVALLIVPQITMRIPRFIMYSQLGLIDTYAPWYLAALGSSAYYVFMFRQFFYALPEELAEAAEMDGCNPLRTFLQVYFPNAKPILATALIFSFSGVWGDYIGPLMYLSDRKSLIAVKLATAFVDPQGNPLPTVTLAANVVYLVPLIVLFFISQRYIMQGVVTSGLKG